MQLVTVLCAALVSGAMSAKGDCDCMATATTIETDWGCSDGEAGSIGWCYVEGGISCNQFKDSQLAGETRKWRMCGSCNCQNVGLRWR